MLGLQASIGAVNDLVDAPRDAGTKPGKPIPRGAASPTAAGAIAVAGVVLGVGLAVPSGLVAVLVLAAAGACGYAYDLRLSRTPFSWLPLAIALPLVPIFAWAGGTGSVPAGLLVLVPAGILAGAGLSLANGLADLERDRASGTRSIAVVLGRERAWLVHAGLLATAVAVLLVSPGAARSAPGGPPLDLGVLATIAGIGALGVGIALGRRAGPGLRERAWELEATGVALAAAGWLAAFGRA